jgi:alanine racemase
MGPTHIKISHTNLINNYNLLKKEIGDSVKVMAMIKANAYGHGLVEVAKTLETQNIAYFGVAYPEEGIQLRKANIKTPILVVGAHLSEFTALHLDYNLDITITHINQLESLIDYCNKKNIPNSVPGYGGGGRGFHMSSSIKLVSSSPSPPNRSSMS